MPLWKRWWRATPDRGGGEERRGQGERRLVGIGRLVRDTTTDLFAPIPHGSGQTPLREALVLAAHNAYHVGQLVLLRRLLGAWKEG